MHRFIVLVAIVFELSLMVAFTGSAFATNQDSSQLRIRQDFVLLKEQVEKQRDQSKKLLLVSQFIQKVKGEITKQKGQTPEVGIWLDTLKGGLEVFPSDKSFSKTQCAQYDQKLRLQYEPTAEKGASFEPVKMAQQILNSICQSAIK